MPLDPDRLTEARENLLQHAVADFARDEAVCGVFLGGSLPAGRSDAWSDLDLRVVIRSDAHPRFVRQRLEIPQRWPGWLFNEWLPGRQHCVSHFRPFVKVDVLYLSDADFGPTPWYGLPNQVLYDPQGRVADVLDRSRALSFEVDPDEIDLTVSKGLAAAHEVLRRLRREDLIYAQTLLEELRFFMVRVDDWLSGRPPQGVVLSGLNRRASAPFLQRIEASYAPLESREMTRVLAGLTSHYREQIRCLHDQFPLTRPLKNDLEAIDLVLASVTEGPRIGMSK